MTDKPVEELRNEIYPICLGLMRKGLETEAYILILSTWNFAAFRYAMTTFDLGKFKEALKGLEPSYRKLEKLDFETIDLDQYETEIKTIYSSLASFGGVKSTGAPKLMHIKNPNLFVMWDSYIRKHYGFCKGDADDYFGFLKLMQERFRNTKARKGLTLARTIDVINMGNITAKEMRR